jgi:hypothetical protein
MQVTAIDDARDKVARVSRVGRSVDHAMLPDAQASPRSVPGDLLDV